MKNFSNKIQAHYYKVVAEKELTPQQQKIRMAVRNFLLTATKPQVEKELKLSQERGDKFRAECVQEWLDEMDK